MRNIILARRVPSSLYPPGTGPGDSPEKIEAARDAVKKDERGPLYILISLGVALALLVVGTVVSAGIGRMGVVVTVFVTASAALVTGGFVGLVFGVPRALGELAGSDGSGKRSTRVGYTANTNLEKFSDWLTAIIVGVTLTQLEQIPALFQRLATFVAGSNGQYLPGGMIAMAVVLFGVGGFLVGFLWSRLHLPLALYEADRLSSEGRDEAEGSSLSVANDVESPDSDATERGSGPPTSAPAAGEAPVERTAPEGSTGFNALGGPNDTRAEVSPEAER